MTLAELHAQMLAQASERRETGRPLQAGDLVHDPGRGYVVVMQACSAVECVEALVELAILARRSERRDDNRG